MNIYEKMATVKLELSKASLKKSGNNKFAGFSYYELGDFLPFLVDACAKHGLLTRVSFEIGLASLTVINTEKPEENIEYTCPYIVPEVKGANKCQNAGAAQTYCRRYLYLAAFDIVEADAYDAVVQKPQAAEPQDNGTTIVVQHGGANREAYYGLLATWQQAGKSEDKLDDWIKTEAAKKGITKVPADFLNALNERIVNYMIAKGA